MNKKEEKKTTLGWIFLLLARWWLECGHRALVNTFFSGREIKRKIFLLLLLLLFGK
jgi:hypothetical protein